MTDRADDRAAIIAALPQEKPFLFVDELIEHTPGESAVGTVTFAADHPVFDGHLPGYPIVPGVIVIEALAQLSGCVLAKPRADDGDGGNGKGFGYLAEVRRVRFRRPVAPGELLRTRSRLGRKLGSAASFEVEADVDGDLVAEGEIVVGGMR